MAGRRKTSNRREKRVRLKKWPRLALYLLLYVSMASLAAWGVLLGYRHLGKSESFRVAAIDIEGATPVISQAVAERLESLMGYRILDINPGELREILLEDKRLSDAEVYCRLPQTVKVRLVEREPAGLARQDDAIYLIDEDGVMICPYQNYGAIVDAPVIIGLDQYEDKEEATRLGMRTLKRIREASLFFWDNIETIDVADSDNMVVRLRGQTAPVYLGDRVIIENLTNYLSIAQHIQDKYPVLDYIELGFPNQVAIMPKKP